MKPLGIPWEVSQDCPWKQVPWSPMTMPPANENAFQTEIKTFKTENLRVRPNCFDRNCQKSARHIGASSTVPAANENAFQTEIKIFKKENL